MSTESTKNINGYAQATNNFHGYAQTTNIFHGYTLGYIRSHAEKNDAFGVVGGDEKGSLKCETVKYGRET
jgi:hypothetical protein